MRSDHNRIQYNDLQHVVTDKSVAVWWEFNPIHEIIVYQKSLFLATTSIPFSDAVIQWQWQRWIQDVCVLGHC